MMGHSHATTGAAAWVALTVPGAGLGIVAMDPVPVVAGAVVSAGGALLPDADHRSGTVARSLPPVSGLVARVVASVAGGHRGATHSLVGITVAFGLAWALAPLRTRTALLGEIQVGAWVLALLLVAFAARALRLTRGWVSSWAVALVAASAAVYHAPEALWWLPMAVGVGCGVHVLGDLLTTQGVPLFWPLLPRPLVETVFWRGNGHLALPVLGTTGSAREWVLVVVIDLYLAWALVTHVMMAA